MKSKAKEKKRKNIHSSKCKFTFNFLNSPQTTCTLRLGIMLKKSGMKRTGLAMTVIGKQNKTLSCKSVPTKSMHIILPVFSQEKKFFFIWLFNLVSVSTNSQLLPKCIQNQAIGVEWIERRRKKKSDSLFKSFN